MNSRERFEAWWEHFKDTHEDWRYADSDELRFQAWQACEAQFVVKLPFMPMAFSDGTSLYSKEQLIEVVEKAGGRVEQ